MLLIENAALERELTLTQEWVKEWHREVRRGISAEALQRASREGVAGLKLADDFYYQISADTSSHNIFGAANILDLEQLSDQTNHPSRAKFLYRGGNWDELIGVSLSHFPESPVLYELVGFPQGRIEKLFSYTKELGVQVNFTFENGRLRSWQAKDDPERGNLPKDFDPQPLVESLFRKVNPNPLLVRGVLQY